MDPFEVYAYWDSWRTSPNLTLTLTLPTHIVRPQSASTFARPRAPHLAVPGAFLMKCRCDSLWLGPDYKFYKFSATQNALFYQQTALFINNELLFCTILTIQLKWLLTTLMQGGK